MARPNTTTSRSRHLFVLTLTVASLVPSALASAIRLAARIPQPQDFGIAPRSDFYGGWPLSATACPADTTSCNYEHTCCPTAYSQCQTGIGEAWCCPDKNDCRAQALALPVCANSSWSAWEGQFSPFCCAPGQTGVFVGLAVGVCADSDVGVPASKLASTVVQVGAATGSPAATSAAGAKASATKSSGGSGSSANAATDAASAATGGSSSSGSSGSSSSNNSGTTSGGSSGLGTGALIGIAIGGVILLLGVVLAGFLCYRRGKRQGMRAQQGAAPAYSAVPPAPPQTYSPPPSQLGGVYAPPPPQQPPVQETKPYFPPPPGWVEADGRGTPTARVELAGR